MRPLRYASEREQRLPPASEPSPRAEDALRRIEGGLGGRHYKTKAQVDRRLARALAPVEGLIEAASGERGGRPTLRWRRDEEAIAQAARSDGLSALATNLPGRLSAGQVLRTYKQQWTVERRHRDLGLIESELQERLGEEELPGLLRQGRSGPTSGVSA